MTDESTEMDVSKSLPMVISPALHPLPSTTELVANVEEIETRAMPSKRCEPEQRRWGWR